MAGSQKKKPGLTEDIVDGMKKGRKPYKKQYKKPNVLQGKNSEASARFRKITERAKKIREKHPKMKWKNCIKQASKELF